MFDFYVQHEFAFAAMQLTLAMAGMGATLSWRDFREVLAEPKSVATGVAIQLLAVPLLCLLLIQLPVVAGGLAIGIALIAAVPGGSVSNMFTYFAKGNTALSIAITAVTTAACLVSTPLILDALIGPYMPADFVMPVGRIALEICAFLLLPLAAGMAFLQWFPGGAALFSRLCIRASLAVIALIVIGSLGAGRLDWQAFGLLNSLLIVGFALLLALLARPLCRLQALPAADSTAIEMEVAVRNINLALLIKASLFPAMAGAEGAVADTVLFSLLLYGGLQLMVGGLLIWRNGRQARLALAEL